MDTRSSPTFLPCLYFISSLAIAADDTPATEEIIVELNRAGYDGALNIEWEDNDVDRFAGAAAALENVRACDLAPGHLRHDQMLAQDDSSD